MSNIVFQHDGSAVFEGIWSTITSARSFDPVLLQPPQETTHWVRYTTGSIANLTPGEILTGGTSLKTCRLVAQVIEQGTAGATTAAGIILVRAVSGAFQAETVTGTTSTGTIAIIQDLIPIREALGPAKALLIEVESFAIQFTVGGTTPTVTAGTNHGFPLVVGASYIARGHENIRKFQAINAVNASGAIMKYALYF